MISDSCHHVPEPGMLRITTLFVHLRALPAGSLTVFGIWCPKLLLRILKHEFVLGFAGRECDQGNITSLRLLISMALASYCILLARLLLDCTIPYYPACPIHSVGFIYNTCLADRSVGMCLDRLSGESLQQKRHETQKRRRL